MILVDAALRSAACRGVIRKAHAIMALLEISFGFKVLKFPVGSRTSHRFGDLIDT
jgi:hypothetical protein